MSRPLFLLPALAFALGAGAALGAWQPKAATTVGVRAATMPLAATPHVSLSNRRVTVSWEQRRLAGRIAVRHRVTRYDATGAKASVAGSCRGAVSPARCAEGNVPPGRWQYSVTPAHGRWRGLESGKSAVVTVAPPTLTLTSGSRARSLPAMVTGRIANFSPREALAFRLDDPATGRWLQGSGTVGTGGTARLDVTLPRGTANGKHTLYVLGSAGSHAAAPLTVDVPPLQPRALAIENGGVREGTPERGDVVTVTFSDRLAVSSLCPTWRGDRSYQSSGGVVRIVDGELGNDSLVVSTPRSCRGSFRFGSIDLGSPDFVDVTTTFGRGLRTSTIAWEPYARRLHITLGPPSLPAAGESGRVTATYRPDGRLRSASGMAVSGTVAVSARHF